MALFGKSKKDTVAQAEEQMVPAGFTQRTPEQVKAALEAAAEARAAKSRLLKDIREGRISLQDMFSPEYADNERVQLLLIGSALRALPSMTQYRASKIMAELGLAKGRRIRGIGVRQREKLLALVGEE
jgi:hypothetical protein